jgi:hypothetical protein
MNEDAIDAYQETYTEQLTNWLQELHDQLDAAKALTPDIYKKSLADWRQINDGMDHSLMVFMAVKIRQRST